MAITPEEPFKSAAQVAYDIIAQKILDGEYAPGQRLSRRKMAEATGVSVIPVIEALKKLEEDHLVESRPRWGSFVAVPTLEKITETYQFREALECEIARILAKSLTPEQKAELSGLAQKLDCTTYSDITADGIREAHYQFHSKLAEFSGNSLLADALERINLFYVLCKAVLAKRPASPGPRYWHQKLVDAIASGDPERAECVMREHIYDSLTAIQERPEIL